MYGNMTNYITLGKKLNRELDDMVDYMHTRKNMIHIKILDNTNDPETKSIELFIINNDEYPLSFMFKNIPNEAIEKLSVSITGVLSVLADIESQIEEIVNELPKFSKLYREHSKALKDMDFIQNSILDYMGVFIIPVSGNGYPLLEVPEEAKDDVRITQSTIKF